MQHLQKSVLNLVLSEHQTAQCQWSSGAKGNEKKKSHARHLSFISKNSMPTHSVNKQGHTGTDPFGRLALSEMLLCNPIRGIEAFYSVKL